MLESVELAALAVMQQLEPTALVDLAAEPEMVALVETAETETPAQMPTAAAVETAATQERQAPDSLTDSPATAATVVSAATVGQISMEITPQQHLPRA